MRTAASSSPHRLPDGQGRAHGPLRIVLVGDRGAEEGDGGVADELLHRSAEALELGAHPGVVRGEHAANLLGIEPFRPGGEADEICKEDADGLSLLRRRRSGDFELLSAGRAEGDVGRHHRGALGHLRPTREPQRPQKSAPTGFSAPQAGQASPDMVGLV